jgi:hypothetical protein
METGGELGKELRKEEGSYGLLAVQVQRQGNMMPSVLSDRLTDASGGS